MEGFIAWCGFVGAWALFAGPIYQAALELREQEIAGHARDRIRALQVDTPKQADVSPWWWLLPPVGYVLHRRKATAEREAMMAAISTDDLGAMIDYINKATGWLLVGAGGFLIGLRETWELVEHYEWPNLVFWLLVAVMGAVSTGYTVQRLSETDRVLKRAGDADGGT